MLWIVVLAVLAWAAVVVWLSQQMIAPPRPRVSSSNRTVLGAQVHDTSQGPVVASAVPPALTAGTGTIGVRVPAHALAAALVEGLDGPVTAPSANPPGASAPTRVDDARAYFGAGVAVYLDGGDLPGGASTVATLEGSTVHVLRPGPVSAAALDAALGER